MTTPAAADAAEAPDPADPTDPTAEPLSVAMVTLGCARNEVDSDELAGRLAAGGFRLVAEPAEADTVVVNTCGFVDAAKKDSVDTLLGAADLKESGDTRAVVAVGCLAERYGRDLAAELPEADAVLGFDDYPDIAARLRGIVAGEQHEAHVPQDRRRLLPISPVERAESTVSVPGHGTGGDAPAQRAAAGAETQSSIEGAAAQASTGGAVAPVSGRTRLSAGPTAPVKLASGCDRRCTFCAIPRFRGSFVSRRPTEVLHEIQGLAADGVREAFLVSENSTSYGKDLGDLRLLERLLPELGAVPDLERVRVSYLQPAEIRPGLLRAMATTPGVAPYFDLSVQHAAAGVLRRMRRFGDAEAFLGLLEQIRELEPAAGVRSNVIVGFPGETEEDVATLCDFLTEARLDAVGVFGYSDEEGTEAASFDDKISEEEIRARTEHVTALAEELTAQRAEERVGEHVRVLVESVEPAHPEDPAAPTVLAAAADGAHGASEHVDRAIEHEDAGREDVVEGRAAHQGPEVDGATRLQGLPPGAASVGDIVPATVVGTDRVDLIAAPRPGSLPDSARAPGSGSRGR